MPISLVSIFNIEPPADATANANLQFNSSTGRAEWVSEYNFQGITSGYASGGFFPNITYNTIDKFSFAANANASDVGDLSQARDGPAGQSSSVSGYSSGGSNPSFGTINTIDKFPFASTANASDVGDLSQARAAVTGQSSSVSGYTSGGYVFPAPSPFIRNTIDKFPFSTNANATDVGDLTEIRRSAAGQSSTTHGYTSGGGIPPATRYATIDKFPFATDANATDVGDLTQVREYAAGQSSTVSGYTSGGFIPAPSVVNTIDKFPFSTDTNATDVGDLTQARRSAAGQSSTASGYTSGGTPAVNTIDKFPFASNANASDVGDLSQSRLGPAGQQV